MPKTNKERLQDNNAELQDIKTGIDNLPDYQDIEPIYVTTEYTMIPVEPLGSNYTGINNVITFDNYMLCNWSYSNYLTTSMHLYKLEDGVYKHIKDTTFSGSDLSGQKSQLTLIDKRGNIVYFGTGRGNNSRRLLSI